MCFASNVFPEQLAPLSFSLVYVDYRSPHPIPTNTTLRFRLILCRTICLKMKVQITKIWLPYLNLIISHKPSMPHI